jgi:hypothetical protein
LTPIGDPRGDRPAVACRWGTDKWHALAGVPSSGEARTPAIDHAAVLPMDRFHKSTGPPNVLICGLAVGHRDRLVRSAALILFDGVRRLNRGRSGVRRFHGPVRVLVGVGRDVGQPGAASACSPRGVHDAIRDMHGPGPSSAEITHCEGNWAKRLPCCLEWTLTCPSSGLHARACGLREHRLRPDPAWLLICLGGLPWSCFPDPSRQLTMPALTAIGRG